MGIGVFLFIVAIIVLASFQYHADMKYLKDDYEKWKHKRK